VPISGVHYRRILHRGLKYREACWHYVMATAAGTRTMRGQSHSHACETLSRSLTMIFSCKARHYHHAPIRCCIRARASPGPYNNCCFKRHFPQLPRDFFCIKNLSEIMKPATTKVNSMVEDLHPTCDPRNTLELPWNIKDDLEGRKVCIDLWRCIESRYDSEKSSSLMNNSSLLQTIV
jgi:hypothetical protein